MTFRVRSLVFARGGWISLEGKRTVTAVADNQRWDRVARWLEQQLAERGVAKRTIVREVRLDQRTLDKLLAGDGITRRDRLGALATYLGYRADAFDLIQRGEEPVRLGITEDDTELRFRAIERRLNRVEELLEDAVRRLAP